MKKRTAYAVWSGSGKEGTGHMSTETRTLDNVKYNWRDRFADGKGTNPEELVAAAHAGCFSMKLSFEFGAFGFEPERIETKCEVTLEDGHISKSHLSVKAQVDGISSEQFAQAVTNAKENCPISKSLKAEISVTHEHAV
jgi:osmotically inducible protein OsmC